MGVRRELAWRALHLIDQARRAKGGLSSRGVSTSLATEIVDGWLLASTPPGALERPPADEQHGLQWHPAVVPGTVAASVGALADLDQHMAYDSYDWWYRCAFPDPRTEGDAGSSVRIRLDGLATLAEVWLNDELLTTSANMFVAQQIDVTDILRDSNELTICFRSLAEALAEKRPRPRWKTELVKNQQLRWFRTTLLGRIPGWTPAIQPVGPWRSIWLELGRGIEVSAPAIKTGWDNVQGKIELDLEITLPSGTQLEAVTLVVEEQHYDLDARVTEHGWRVGGHFTLDWVDAWWPQTLGEPSLYDCFLEVRTSSDWARVDLGRLGFRTASLNREDGRVQLLLNGVPVFCRGACWTTNDVLSLSGDPADLRRTLNWPPPPANMVRVGGTMVYESDEFYQKCDRLGLMVWQDFMFANMDYPTDDGFFLESVQWKPCNNSAAFDSPLRGNVLRRK